MGLNRDARRILSQYAPIHGTASRSALMRVSAEFSNHEWLSPSNRYRSNTTKVLEADAKASGINHEELEDYIAASALLHCVDGWSYLGHAVSARLTGDADAARHLGYYAELRAAMAILATEGIGVFDKIHYYIESLGNCKEIGRDGTHVFAADALLTWAGSQRAADLLMDVIRPEAIPLSTWLQSLDTSVGQPPVRIMAHEWLSAWGLDLKRLSEDRQARNQSSYRPSRLLTGSVLSLRDSVNFVCSLWSVLAPSGDASFRQLDRYLLRMSLEKYFDSFEFEDPAPDGSNRIANLTEVVPELLSNLGIGGDYSDELNRFLIRTIDGQDPELLVLASQPDPISSERHHMQVMARATMLLRVATGACRQMVQGTSITGSDLTFWWQRLGEDKGFWEPGDPPESLSDLWDDVIAAVDDTRNWPSAIGPSQETYARLHLERSREIMVLGGCERVALWSLVT